MRPEQQTLVDAVRAEGSELIQLITQAGRSREFSIAITRVEEAVMWAVRGITADKPQRPDPNSSMRSFFVDLFDRIAAAIAAKNSGDNPALDEHIAAIDAHLQSLDADDAAAKAAVLGLQGDDTSSQARLTAIEAGLQKVADAVDPTASSSGASASSGTDSSSGTTSSGTGTADSSSGSSGTDTSGAAPADPTA